MALEFSTPTGRAVFRVGIATACLTVVCLSLAIWQSSWQWAIQGLLSLVVSTVLFMSIS